MSDFSKQNKWANLKTGQIAHPREYREKRWKKKLTEPPRHVKELSGI